MNEALTIQEQKKLMAYIKDIRLYGLQVDVNKFTTVENTQKYLQRKSTVKLYREVLYGLFSFGLFTIALNGLTFYIMSALIIAYFYYTAQVMEIINYKIAKIIEKLEKIHRYSIIK